MPKVRRIAGNVIFNWISLAVVTLTGFFLAPFVVHRLGNVAYGVWVLVASLNSYMGLLDLGMRGAVTRFVSKGYAQGDHARSSAAVSGALWIRIWLSAAIVFVGIGFSAGFHRFFSVPPALLHDARLAILVTAASMAITLSFGVFGGTLAALHRYDALSGANILQTLVRAGGVLWLLTHGHGILALALCELVAVSIANFLQLIFCLRSYPELKVFFRRPSRETLQDLWGYSFYAFVINVAIQLVYYTDNLVVGAFASAASVTLYAIGGSLIGYARSIIGSMTTTFMPLASTFEAQGQQNHLRSLLIQGTRATLLVSLPIELALFFRGHTFIGLWMGKQYAEPSGTVLQVLLISLIVSAGSSASGGIVYGTEKHRRVALWAILEGASNLILSVILIRRMGIIGVAWGTTLPSLFVEVVLWPPYICKLVNIELWEYVWQTWIRTGIAILPFAAACYLAERYWPAGNLAFFLLQSILLLPLFAIGLGIVYWKELRHRLNTRLGWFRKSDPQTPTIINGNVNSAVVVQAIETNTEFRSHEW